MSTDQQLERPAARWKFFDFLVKYRRTLMLCGLVALLTMQRYAAFMLMFVLLPFTIWLIYGLIVACRDPQRRAWQLTRISIWLLTFALIGAVHWIRHQTNRADGDRIAAALDQYKKKKGAFPASIEEIGEDSKNLRRESMLYYSNKDGNPLLILGSVLTPFDRYIYDFQNKAWIFVPD